MNANKEYYLNEFRQLLKSSKYLSYTNIEKEQFYNRVITQKMLTRQDIDFVLSQQSSQLLYKLSIVSLNLGYNVMSNIITGSEGPAVKICQDMYPKNKGLASDRRMAQCTANAADFLLSYDLFGLQEVNGKHQPEFEKYIREQGFKFGKDYHFITGHYFGNWGVTIGYDKNIMGEANRITPDGYLIGVNPNDMRGIQAVYFRKYKLLFVNVHAPHEIDLVTILNKMLHDISIRFQKLGGNLKDIMRVIMTGDFNDDRRLLVGASLKFDKLSVRIPGDPGKIPKTCCTDTGYKFIGDYILDSKVNSIASGNGDYFGLPPGYDRNKVFLSDHDPIVLIEN